MCEYCGLTGIFLNLCDNVNIVFYHVSWIYALNMYVQLKVAFKLQSFRERDANQMLN